MNVAASQQPLPPPPSAIPVRRALPDYPESSDAYEEDDDTNAHRRRYHGPTSTNAATAATKTTSTKTTTTTTTTQKHQRVYHVEPIENRYYASQAHLTAESYIADPDHLEDGDDDEEIIVQEDDDDDGDAGDDEQEWKDVRLVHGHDIHRSYLEDDDNVSAPPEEDGTRGERPGREHGLAAVKTEELQMNWGLLSAHKLSIAEMVEVCNYFIFCFCLRSTK